MKYNILSVVSISVFLFTLFVNVYAWMAVIKADKLLNEIDARIAHILEDRG